MKLFSRFPLLLLAGMLFSSCSPAQPNIAESEIGQSKPSANSTQTTEEANSENTVSPSPTPSTSVGWSTTASTRTELSFAFPGTWDGSSPLTFGEGEFVKDPDSATGMTFQIGLSGDPAALLAEWGKKAVGIVGIITFTPEKVKDCAILSIARIPTPTKVGEGNGVTAQVAYIQRATDVLEVMWFAPTDQWDSLQSDFQGVLGSIEIWTSYTSVELGLHTMYVHDWLPPSVDDFKGGLWFRSADEHTGVLIISHDQIADPVALLGEWTVERLEPLSLSECNKKEGDRLGSLGGQWESVMGECKNVNGSSISYETAYVPNKNRLLEIITYAPVENWADATETAFGYLLGMMVDIR